MCFIVYGSYILFVKDDKLYCVVGRIIEEFPGCLDVSVLSIILA